MSYRTDLTVSAKLDEIFSFLQSERTDIMGLLQDIQAADAALGAAVKANAEQTATTLASIQAALTEVQTLLANNSGGLSATDVAAAETAVTDISSQVTTLQASTAQLAGAPAIPPIPVTPPPVSLSKASTSTTVSSKP